jgi:sugar phosphate permease
METVQELAPTTSGSAPGANALEALGKPTRIRGQVLILSGLVYLVSYMDRGNISVVAPEIAKEFGLSKTEMGLVFAAFTWTYALGAVPVGWLGDRFGPRRVLSFIMCGIGLAPIMTGMATGLGTLLGSRLFLGVAESGGFPVTIRGMQTWFPKSERGRIHGILHCFSRFAVAVTPAISVAIMLAWGWRAVFFVFGAFGFLWTLLWLALYRNNPEEHKSVNRAELARIRGLNPDGSIKPLNVVARPKIPWRHILRSWNMWYIAVGYCCYFFGTNFYLTWYPTYLREYRHMSLEAVGLLGALPLLAAMAGNLVGGTITDAIFQKTGRTKLARRAVAAPGFILAGLCVIPAATTDSSLISLLCLTGSFFCLEWASAAAWAVPMDVGGQYSGTVSAIMNGAGALAASLTAFVYGTLFQYGFWIAPFFVTAGVMFAGALIWIFLINPDKSVIGTAGGT